jgi:hypothetical protein
MMTVHPINRSWRTRVAAVLLLAGATGVLWALLVLYAVPSPWVALADSAVYTGVLGAAGFFSWYLTANVEAVQARRGVALVGQVVALSAAYLTVMLTGIEGNDVFLRGLPLRVLFGLFCWVDLMLWYSRQTATAPEEAEEADTVPEAAVAPEDVIDRITVKEGSRIHLIYIEHLLCIQASGDYTLLVTAEGQHLKEQTMKYFETHLPTDSFVRIHRSCIVNVRHILRVEIFGKESYRVRMDNGLVLRASAAGYRLLRQRLGL